MIKGQDSSSPGRPDAPGNGRAPGSKRAASEARMLKAAEEVFAQTGFAGARTAQIAQRAGLPKANLHYYFRTKEAIYQRVLENVLEVWLGMGNSIQPGADPTEALDALHRRQGRTFPPPPLRLQGVRQRDPARRAPAQGLPAQRSAANGSTRKPRSSKAGPPPAKWPPSTAATSCF